MMNRHTFDRMLLTLACVLAASWAGAGTPIDETRPFQDGGAVSIENLAGRVTVTGWDRDEVHVTGELARTARRLEIEGDARRLEIRVDQEGGRREHEGTTLDVRLPRGVDLEVEGVSLVITVRDLDGRLEIETVSGSVEVHGSPRALEVATVSGGITVQEAPDRTELESVSGGIEVVRAAGSIDVETVSGSIAIKGGNLRGADLESVSGTVRIDADDLTGDIDAETVSGRIVLTVDSGIGADFELSTFSGGIDNAIGPEPKRTSQYTPGREAVFSTGGGGARIRLTTFSGRITLDTR
jgi:DUF4097 and DUF4098 domain-containing protein YvlB